MATLKDLKKKHRWLITGGAGFIGSNLSNYLLEKGQNVAVFDNLSTGKKKNILFLKKRFRKNFTFLKYDIRNFKHCLSVTKNIDFVLHNAALGSVPRSIKNPKDTHDNNVNGFLNILEASKINKVKKFVFASSSSVYGDSKSRVKKESELGNALSPYAVTKMNNEHYAKVYANLYNMKIVALRYFNVFGSNQDQNSIYSAVIPKWIKMMQNKEIIPVFGDGKNSRDFCYIDNVIQANILSVFDKKIKNFEVFNVALGKETNLNNLLKKISKIFNVKNVKKKYLKPRIGDVRYSIANISKIKKFLNYNPRFRIDTGLKEIYKKQINNKNEL
jgi:UDP-N-acetylglucosamine 4-epimerase